MFTNWKNPVAVLLLAGLAFTALAEDGVSDDRILIGQTIGISGQIAGAVKEMNEGAQAYLSQVNKR